MSSATAITALERNDVDYHLSQIRICLIQNLILEIKSEPGETAKKVVQKYDYIL